MVEPEFEIRHVPEPVGLSFQCFDLVDKAFNYTVGDPVLKVVEQSRPVGSQSPGHPGQGPDPGGHGIPAPGLKETPCLFRIGDFPEKSQLLFHGVHQVQGLVDPEQPFKTTLAPLVEAVVVSKKQKPDSFESLLPQLIELPLIVPSEFIYGLIHQGHDMIAVEDHRYIRKDLLDRPVVGMAHVHGDPLEPFSLCGQSFQKRHDAFLAFSFYRLEDSACFQIHKDRHIMVPPSDAEFVDTDIGDLVEGDPPIESHQLHPVDLFDEIPADIEISCHRLDGPETEQIQDGQGKGPNKPVFPIRKGHFRPSNLPTTLTLDTMDIQCQLAVLSAYHSQDQVAGLVPLENHIPTPTLRTPVKVVFEPGPEDNPRPLVRSRLISDSLQTKNMIQNRCGHVQDLLRLLNCCQTTGVLPCPFFFDNPQVSFFRKNQK